MEQPCALLCPLILENTVNTRKHQPMSWNQWHVFVSKLPIGQYVTSRAFFGQKRTAPCERGKGTSHNLPRPWFPKTRPPPGSDGRPGAATKDGGIMG